MEKLNQMQLTKTNTVKVTLTFCLAFIVVSCGKEEENFDLYTIEKAEPRSLELIIEASGSVEAISSIEIKSKASGEVLFLGAEVGDFVDKGFMLAQIDQRTANNIVDQTKSDLEAANVRLVNAESQYDRGIELHKQSSISDKDFEDIKENYAQAKSTLVRNEVSYENAKKGLEKLDIDHQEFLKKEKIDSEKLLNDENDLSKCIEKLNILQKNVKELGEDQLLEVQGKLAGIESQHRELERQGLNHKNEGEKTKKKIL